MKGEQDEGSEQRGSYFRLSYAFARAACVEIRFSRPGRLVGG